MRDTNGQIKQPPEKLSAQGLECEWYEHFYKEPCPLKVNFDSVYDFYRWQQLILHSLALKSATIVQFSL